MFKGLKLSVEDIKFNLSQGRPLYWRHEVSGRMAEIVRKFLDRQRLDDYELKIIRWYVFQWVDAMPFKPANYGDILAMSQKELLEYVTGTLLDYGIDPF